MRVLVVNHTSQLGGAEISLRTWLANTRHRPDLLLFEDGELRREAEKLSLKTEILPGLGRLLSIRRDAPVFSLIRNGMSLFTARRSLRKKLRGYDAVIANSQKAFVLAALAWDGSWELIWDLNDILTPEHFSKSLMRLTGFLAKRTNCLVVANSPSTASAFVANGGRRDRVVTIAPFIDLSSFREPNERAIAEIRHRMRSDKFVLVGLFGRLCPWKGQHILLKAAARVPRIKVILVGDALFGEAEYKNQLIEIAADPALQGRVEMLGHRTDVPLLMKAVEIAVHCSTLPEPFGRVIAEAVSAGRPVIASKGGGMDTIVEELQCGLHIEPDSVDSLVDALNLLVERPELRQEMSARASAATLKMLSLQENIALYDHLVDTEGLRHRNVSSSVGPLARPA